jgi:hypothetical protein
MNPSTAHITGKDKRKEKRKEEFKQKRKATALKERHLHSQNYSFKRSKRGRRQVKRSFQFKDYLRFKEVLEENIKGYYGAFKYIGVLKEVPRDGVPVNLRSPRLYKWVVREGVSEADTRTERDRISDSFRVRRRYRSQSPY